MDLDLEKSWLVLKNFHPNFQNPTLTLSGRNVRTAEKKMTESYLILPISAQVPASNSQVSSTPSPCSDKFVGWGMETTSWQDMLWMFCQVPSLHPSHGSGGWEIYVSSMGCPTLRTGWHHSQVSCKLSLWLRQLYCSIGLPSWGPRPCHSHLWNIWEQTTWVWPHATPFLPPADHLPGRWRRPPLRQGCSRAGTGWKPSQDTGHLGTRGVCAPYLTVGSPKMLTRGHWSPSYSPVYPCLQSEETSCIWAGPTWSNTLCSPWW